jgi:hypothetical protein
MWNKTTLPVAIVLALAATTARGDYILQTGNNPGSNEENVLFNGAVNGTTVTGHTNISNTAVDFASSVILTAPNNGQARVESLSGADLTDLIISAPGMVFTDLIFNINYVKDKNNKTSLADITVNGSSPSTTFLDNSLGNGQNFFTLTTTNGDTISSVEITIPDGSKGFSDLRQIRISGLEDSSTSGQNVVPEPSSLALGLGGLSLCCLAWLRRKTAIYKEEGRIDDTRLPLAF